MKRMNHRAKQRQQSIGGVLDYAKLAQLCPQDPGRHALAVTGDEAVRLHVAAWNTKPKQPGTANGEVHPAQELTP